MIFLWYTALVAYFSVGFAIVRAVHVKYGMSWWEYPTLLIFWFPIVVIASCMDTSRI